MRKPFCGDLGELECRKQDSKCKALEREAGSDGVVRLE